MDLSATVISLSDFIVVPLSPSPCDVWATLDTLSIIRAGMRANPNLKTLIVINQAIQNCTINKEVFDLLAEHAPDFRIAAKPVIGRISFAKSGMSGQTIYETKDRAAMEEIDDLTLEIMNYLNEEINTNENTQIIK
jgi:chromosome partitioning protein